MANQIKRTQTQIKMPLIILLLEANKSNHFRQKLPKIWATRTTEKENENIWWYYTSDNHFDFNRSWGMNGERRREGLSLSVSVVTGAKWERGFDLSHPTSFHISTSEKKTRKKQTQRKRGGELKPPMIWMTAGWGGSCGCRRFRHFTKQQGLSAYGH